MIRPYSETIALPMFWKSKPQVSRSSSNWIQSPELPNSSMPATPKMMSRKMTMLMAYITLKRL